MSCKGCNELQQIMIRNRRALFEAENNIYNIYNLCNSLQYLQLIKI